MQVDNAKALKVADEEAMHHEAMKDRRQAILWSWWVLMMVSLVIELIGF